MSNTLRRVALITLLCMACGNAPKPDPSATAAPPAAVAAATAAEAATAAAEGSPADAGVINVTPYGVPECDNYVKKFTACIESKVTGPDKDKLLEGFEANRTKWRALATMQQGAVALGLACRAANQKAKEELSVEYGCEF